MGISPTQMLKDSVQNQENIFDVLGAIRSYPFLMKNQSGHTFKPDDVINLIKNNIDADGRLKRDISQNPIFDNTYGLKTVLGSLAEKQNLQQQVTQPARDTSSLSQKKGMLFSARNPRESAATRAVDNTTPELARGSKITSKQK